MRVPSIIGHRGARACAPENTLAGIAEATRQGARMVELDVKLTRDGVPILMHDETLATTTGIEHAVADTDFADLAALDTLPRFRSRYPIAGQAFVERQGSAPVRIPTLEKVLALAFDLGIALNLELKPCPGRDAETAAVAIDIARHAWPRHKPPPLLSSFSTACLAVAQRAAPDWPRGLLVDRPGPDWRDSLERLEAAFLGVNAERLTAPRAASLLEARTPLVAWTVNRLARARQLRRWGVAAIFTDRPAALINAGAFI